MVDQDFDNGVSESTTINTAFDLYADSQFSKRLRLNERTLTLNMSGGGSHTASIRVGGNNWLTAIVVQKSQSELNVSSGDEFGAWK
ncbi:MAG: hypothetical protein LBB48_06905 [Treponema sp.]|jgi:hypothetical protein|nr:hypothetical protein [Treponema sp.]